MLNRRVSVLAACAASLVGATAAADPGPGAAPPKPTTKVVLDPVRAKQLTPRPLGKDEIAALAASSKLPPRVKTSIKRLDPAQIAQLLNLPDPDALPPPRSFDARTSYHDGSTYLELDSRGGSIDVRTARNYVIFRWSDAVATHDRPFADLHFEAAPATRYVLECDVDASTRTTITARDGRNEYAVTSEDKVTLVYVNDHTAGVAEQITVRIAGDRSNWYIDGCRLTASRR